MLRGPSDEDLDLLRADANFQPKVAIEGQKQRVQWELDTERVLNENPKWRRGRLRDVIGAREIVHEWIDMYTQVRIDRRTAGLPAHFDPPDNEMRSFMGSMPHTQVLISVKTRYHKNPLHKWTVNDIIDMTQSRLPTQTARRSSLTRLCGRPCSVRENCGRSGPSCLGVPRSSPTGWTACRR